jgi:tetratricopeptide (TPR) repeat protein
MNFFVKIFFLAVMVMPIVACCLDSDCKKRIIELRNSVDVEADKTEKSKLLIELAKQYYTDQDQVKAFENYLYALELIKDSFVSKVESSSKENAVYEKALKLYLSGHGASVGEVSKQIIDEYAPFLEKVNDYQLRFLLAVSYANLGDFPKFFDHFYNAYTKSPDHFLAHKAIAVLHIKLYERSCPGEKKEAERIAIMEHLTKASERYPDDSSIYKLMIGYCAYSNKNKVVTESINKIIERNLVVPRGDLDFYIQSSLATGDMELTQRFLNCAKGWYQFSRSIAAAQQTIDGQKM